MPLNPNDDSLFKSVYDGILMWYVALVALDMLHVDATLHKRAYGRENCAWEHVRAGLFWRQFRRIQFPQFAGFHTSLSVY